MCRMFALKGSPLLASYLQASLIEAAKKDDFSNGESHKDGWGFVAYCDSSQMYYRSALPIFQDGFSSLAFHGFSSPVAAISHARFSAPGEPVRGPFDSHPFSTHIGENLVYVSHNGWIDKRKLVSKLSLEPSRLNDTEIFTYFLEGEGDVEQRLVDSIKKVKQMEADIGALNLFVLVIKRSGEREVLFYSDFKPKDRAKELYYTLYSYESEWGCAVMSSSVAFKAGFIDQNGNPQKDGVRVVPKGRLGKII